jgi:hypothetical protein
MANLFEDPVVSSWISDLTYDEEKGCTIMTTKTGKQYPFRMNKDKYESWHKFWSKGRFYHRAVKLEGFEGIGKKIYESVLGEEK